MMHRFHYLCHATHLDASISWQMWLKLVGIIRNWFTLIDLFETTRVKGLAKMDCITDEAAIIKELL